MVRVESRDLPLLLCRVAFIFAVVGFGLVWPQLSPDDRFRVVVLGIAAAFALGLSRSFHGLCSTLMAFGGIIVALSLFTIATGYDLGRFHSRVVERASGVPSLIIGTLIVGVAAAGKRSVRRP